VFDGLGEVALVVAEPEAGVLGDIELAGGVVGETVAPVLSWVPLPWTVALFWATWKSMVHGRSAWVSVLSASSSLLYRSSRSSGEDGVFGGVVAHCVEERVGHIGLEADGAGMLVYSRSCTMRRQECMPPQQISPSAAMRSPCCWATLPASRKVSAIFFWLPSGSCNQSSTPEAESMRMTP